MVHRGCNLRRQNGRSGKEKYQETLTSKTKPSCSKPRESWDLESHYSSWPQLIRLTAYVLKFVSLCRASNSCHNPRSCRHHSCSNSRSCRDEHSALLSKPKFNYDQNSACIGLSGSQEFLDKANSIGPISRGNESANEKPSSRASHQETLFCPSDRFWIRMEFCE